MLIDLHDNQDVDLPISEVCVVGAGAAGITLAERLAALGHDVCLLESGGLDFEQDTQDLYKGANIGMPYYDLDESRLRFFGGTVSIWGGRCALLDPIDFQRRDWVPYSGWPIDRTDLDSYYRQAHEQLELGKYNYEEDIWGELGLDDPGFDPRRIDIDLWRFDESTERFTSARRKELLNSPRIRVLLHANAIRIQAGPEARTVEHILVQPLGGSPRVIKAKHYILATGTIENCRLLLASNDVEKAGVGNARDQVGRFFMEHPAGRIGKVETDQPYELWAAFQKRFMRSGPPLAPALRLGDDAQRELGALNSIATFKLQRDPARGVAVGNRIYHNLKHSIAPSRYGRALDHAYRAVRAWIHREVRNGVERFRARHGLTELYLITRGEQAPNPDSRVILSDQRDALDQPRANLAWQLSAIDKHTAKVFAETLGRELHRLGKGSVVLSDWLHDPDPRWPIDPTVGNHPLANYHQLGGTRMSATPSDGVVDANSKVHGYENLYVAGSSVFTTGGWANPTLTILALSLRLADHLSARLKSGS